MAMLLQGKTAIVTGAHMGVGRAVAMLFAEAGAKLMLTGEDENELASTEGDVRDLLDKEDRDPHVARFACNIEERLGVTNLVAATLDSFGRIDILVNAGRQAQPGVLADLTYADMDRAHRENVAPVFMLSQAVSKRMIAQHEEDREFRGAIVNISSIAAQRTTPDLFAYSVACAALDQMTRSTAACLAEHGIRVNGVSLGSVMTRNLRNSLRERPDLRDEMVRITPLGRIGEVSEAAQAVMFLASPQSSFVTGQILTVDGGRLILDPLASPER